MSHITEVIACQPVSPSSPDDWRTSLGQILVIIKSSDGQTGYGVGGGGKAALHIIDALLKDLLLGQPVDEIETHWQRCHRALLPIGADGVAMLALSGIDLALWDLAAKQQNLPVAKILNPEVDLNRKIPTYQTVWDEIPEDLLKLDCGIKLHVGLGNDKRQLSSQVLDRLADQVIEARNAIGPGRMLAVDAWMQWDVETTLEFAARVENLNLAWIEEPLPVDDHAGYEILRDECPVPIAGGEHLFALDRIAAVIRNELHSILQPDATWAGGLTGLLKIFEMADDAELQVIPHRGAEPWALHAIAALSPAPLAESPRPWIDWFTGEPQFADGTVTLNASAGFGVELKPDVVERNTSTIQ